LRFFLLTARESFNVYIIIIMTNKNKMEHYRHKEKFNKIGFLSGAGQAVK